MQNILFELIYSLPSQDSQIQSLAKLQQQLLFIQLQIKQLKIDNVEEIDRVCPKNKKLWYVSKMLKENFFKYRKIATDKEIQLENKPSFVGDQSLLPILQSQVANFSQKINHQQRIRMILVSLFHHLLSRKKMLNFIIAWNIPFYVYQIIVRIYSKYHKQENKQTNNHKQEQILMEKIGKDSQFIENKIIKCLKRIKIQKCLKFIYHFICVIQNNMPIYYVSLIKDLLNSYDKDYQKLFSTHETQIKRERVKLCYSYLFETAQMILQKNLFIAAKYGIASLLYQKCIEGKLTLSKTQKICSILIQYCLKQQTRSIIHQTIDFGQTFAIFTNVDLVESNNQQQLSKNKDKIQACSIMIQMYLSSWPTLVYFIHEKNTLRNFITALKRKSQKQIDIINSKIFNKIVLRALNYSKHKMRKSNNIFSLQSNYLNLKSIILFYEYFKYSEFNQIILNTNTNNMKLKQGLSQILLQYFMNKDTGDKKFTGMNIQINTLLIKNIKYFKEYNVAINQPYQKQNEIINNNIQSYCSDSIISYEFNVKELKNYLIRLLPMIISEQLKVRANKMFEKIQKYQKYNNLYCNIKKSQKQNEQANTKGPVELNNIESNKGSNSMGKIELKDKNAQSEVEAESEYLILQGLLLQFYKIAFKCCKQIKWKDNNLDISKYLSSIVGHLRNKGYKKLTIVCRKYIRKLFQESHNSYFQFLQVNLFDDIGKYFYDDYETIQLVKSYLQDPNYAYKISRILLHIEYQRSLTSSQHGSQKIYTQICKNGSDALVLQIIEIFKFNCYQNQNRFHNEHLQIIFNYLIYHQNNDIVYSIIQLLEEFINKSSQLEAHILKIDIKRILQLPAILHKKILYLFLHYQSAIKLIDQVRPNFLKQELDNWMNIDMKRKYYSFFTDELEKYTNNSTKDNQYLNLGFDPANYQKLIFLPWNIKINQQLYPIFIEYKNLQDKLKLKVYLNFIILKDIFIEQLFIGSHQYTKYVNIKNNLIDKEDSKKISLNIEEIKKKHKTLGEEPKNGDKFIITKYNCHFFIYFDMEIYKIEKIYININLTIDTYRPLIHPLNYINLLIRTKYGYNFLKQKKFIDNCLQMVKSDKNSYHLDDIKGALVCLGTLCGSHHIHIALKGQVYQIINRHLFTSNNFQIQQISLWLLNILSKDFSIRSKMRDSMVTIETKHCGWICIPIFQKMQQQTFSYNEKIRKSIQYMKKYLPKMIKIQNSQSPSDIDIEMYQYLYDILNGNYISVDKQLKLDKQFQEGRVGKNVFQSILDYISLINFQVDKIYLVLHKLSQYIATDQFDDDFSTGIHILYDQQLSEVDIQQQKKLTLIINKEYFR